MRAGRHTPSVSCSILTLAESGMRWEPSLMPGTQLEPILRSYFGFFSSVSAS